MGEAGSATHMPKAGESVAKSTGSVNEKNAHLARRNAPRSMLALTEKEWVQ